MRFPTRKLLSRVSPFRRRFSSSSCWHRCLECGPLSCPCYEQNNSRIKTELILCSSDVRSTLSRCPSDLIALSFFLWTVQRHSYNYSRDPLALDSIVPAIQRLVGRHKTIQAILSQLETIGCFTKPMTFLLLLRVFHRVEMDTMVLEAYHLMQSSGFVPNTFARNLVMDVLFRIGKPSLALSVFHHTSAPSFLTFSYAIRGLFKLNDVARICYVVRSMLRMGYYPNASMLEMIFNCFCKMDRLLEAYQVMGLMISLGFQVNVNVWTVLIHEQCKLGRLNVASNLLVKMAETGCSPNVVTYTVLFKAFMQFNMVNEGFDLLNVMLSTGQIPDLVLSNVLIDCLSKVGRYRDAIEVFAGLSRQNMKPDSYTLSSVLSTISLSRKFHLLDKVVFSDADADLVLCNSLMCSLIKAGLLSRAVQFYVHMIDKGFTPDKYTFAGLLIGLCEAGRIDEAVNVYRYLIKSTDDIDAHIHTVIIGGLVKVRKYHMAVDVFRLAVMKQYPLDFVAYVVGTSALLRGRRTEEACAVYGQMKVAGFRPDVHICNRMLYAFCREKDLQMVEQMLQEMIDLRIELSDRNFYYLWKFLSYRSGTCFHALNLLSVMRGLGLLSSKVLQFLSLDVHAEGTQAKDKHYAKADFSSEGEDESDLAASVC